MAELSEENSRALMESAVAAAADIQIPAMDGTGIIICGGGLRYFTCAWVCLKMLRHLGCRLPVDLWHLGPTEMNDTMRQLVETLDVLCVDAIEVRNLHPARILNGWEIKPYAIIHSRFRHVLLLDADNVAVVNPEHLFAAPQYIEHGAIFWPDYGRLGPNRSIWRLTGVPYRDEPEFETGQIAIDKRRCWRALSLTMWMNEHSDFWYNHIHGDKETFHMAWRKLGQSYAMPSKGVHRLGPTMCQHDFDGKRLFQHRHADKWSLSGNRRVPGFENESLCREFVEQLKPHMRGLKGLATLNRELAANVAGRRSIYHRVGHDQRTMVFQADGTVGLGSDRMERYWHVVQENGQYILEIYGDDGLTAKLFTSNLKAGKWQGRWLIHERMPLELIIDPS